MKRPSYRFYPTLLDSFTNYMNADEMWETFYGGSEEPSVTLDEYETKAFKELIDHINRVPFVSEPASCGTAFNELVDCILLGLPFEQSSKEMKVETDNESKAYIVTIDNFKFVFDSQCVIDAALYFEASTPQYRCCAMLPTQFGDVELYGNIDYLRENVVYDAKTTRNYQFGKFAEHWQKLVYPYCLIESGDCTDIKEFEFTVFKLNGTTRISYDQYSEVYTYDHEKARHKLVEVCEKFIEFLENHKDIITDKKIFGGENEVQP